MSLALAVLMLAAKQKSTWITWAWDCKNHTEEDSEIKHGAQVGKIKLGFYLGMGVDSGKMKENRRKVKKSHDIGSWMGHSRGWTSRPGSVTGTWPGWKWDTQPGPRHAGLLTLFQLASHVSYNLILITLLQWSADDSYLISLSIHHESLKESMNNMFVFWRTFM